MLFLERHWLNYKSQVHLTIKHLKLGLDFVLIGRGLYMITARFNKITSSALLQENTYRQTNAPQNTLGDFLFRVKVTGQAETAVSS